MNRGLAEAVVAAFRDDEVETLHSRLAQFDESAWMATLEWLHTSGLALYFLRRCRELGIENVIPAKVFHSLQNNYAENRVRTAGLFDEFVRLNVEFQRAKLCYANLKGFTLVPHSCADPASRYQHDLDFLVSRRDAERCRQAVERHGYRLTAVFGDTWEFRAGPAEVSTMRELYQVRAQRSLELHVLPEQEQSQSGGQGDRLSRLQLQLWNGFEFPALSECDKLLAQAMHLFKHFQCEWTRAAWMLEYARALRSHEGNDSFWQEAADAMAAAPETKVGVGMATLVTISAFGITPPAQFLTCTVDEMPNHVRLWVSRYQEELVFLEHPGSKLYLLLKDVLLQDGPDWQSQRRRRLFPSHLPPQHVVASRNDGVGLKTRLLRARLGFVLARLRFHVTEGLRYKIGASRWKKFVADLRT